jgi:putative nucleotidyltransferase with HDIG domain
VAGSSFTILLKELDMNDENASVPIQNGDAEKESLSIILDSNYPLLKSFRDRASGTYKHSQNLASMVEGVSMELGLDVLFMKAAALYHDIGKVLHPRYFTENQVEEENPHDKLDPFVSYLIISRHVSDTANILIQDPNFPRKLIEIACQHHGQSVVKYFFAKSGSEVEDTYRYKGKKPTCIEAMVLLVCDSIEARSRAEVKRDTFDPKAIIEETIKELLEDGQLQDVIMRLGDLQKLKTALAKELQGTYQKRVDYAEAKKGEKNIK